MKNQEQIDQIWAEYDKDGDGNLDLEEAKEFITNYHRKSSQKGMSISDSALNKMFAIIDKSGDGLISKEEISKYINILFN